MSRYVGGGYMTESEHPIRNGTLDAHEGARDTVDARSEAPAPEGDELGHPHPQTGLVQEVLRRRSPIDPPDGSWAVIGVGTEPSVVLDALESVGISAVGYEKTADLGRRPDQVVRFDHVVVSVDEIDDIEGLAVTSRDRLTGEINTDYYVGIVVATRNTRFCGDLVDPDDSAPLVMRRVFTPHNPAVVLVGPVETESDATPVTRAGTDPVGKVDTDSVPRAGAKSSAGVQADFVAAYARLLADSPRRALSFHRGVCAAPERPRDVGTAPGGLAEQKLSAADVAVDQQDLTELLHTLQRETANPS